MCRSSSPTVFRQALASELGDVDAAMAEVLAGGVPARLVFDFSLPTGGSGAAVDAGRLVSRR